METNKKKKKKQKQTKMVMATAKLPLQLHTDYSKRNAQLSDYICSGL